LFEACWRGLLDMLRNPLLTAFHTLGGLLLGLLVGIIFFSGACIPAYLCVMRADFVLRSCGFGMGGGGASSACCATRC
jgi:hypothetical protein